MTTLVLDSSQPFPLGVSPVASPLPGAALLGPPDPAILDRNLAALSRTCARTAQLIRSSPSRTDLRFLQTDDREAGVEVVDYMGMPRAICSRRRPVREGEQLVESIDVAATAAVAVMGFGAGYHVGALARRMRRTGVIAVFEPDTSLLRSIFERIDHSAWLEGSNTAIFTDPDDAAAITASLSGVEGIVMMGLALFEHAPSLDRLGESRTRFYKNLQDVIAAVRTTVATSMVQVGTTVANLLRNVGWYVSSPGIADLAGSRAGTPAIVVSAGPSLQRNIDQLARPGVRERFTIIAAQTVLKPLLARGIKPHFVVALDHSEISARFYEGLSREDVEGVTLVVEPKVWPAVPAAFPGEVRLARDPFLDGLLGPGLARDMGNLQPGATVAHLACYLARHLGADPVVLVGQDLGFTDGQYYAAGAAIHDVWACELNEFNSLERMEWERIKRMGVHLRRATDHLARPIYTDEQLATYLVQFERDFLADAHRGLSVIDATEGGVAKRHTRAERLGDVVDRVLATPAPAEAPAKAGSHAPHVSARRAEDRIREVAMGVHRVADISRRTADLLEEMLANHADQRHVGRLIDRVHALRDEVEVIQPAMDLVHYLNQAGGFSRVRSDRAIQLDTSLSPLERQRREIERDTTNVRQLARTADDLASELNVAAAALVRWQHDDRTPAARSSKTGGPADVDTRAHAVLTVPAEMANADVLRLTLQRLDRAERIDSIALLAADPDRVRSWIETLPMRCRVRVYGMERGGDDDRLRMRAARAPASDCWRAGLAGAGVYDEVFAPEDTLRVIEELGVDLVLIAGAYWCLIDPVICDSVIERAGRAAGTHRMSFSQAAPGLAGMVVNRALVSDLVKLRRGTGPFATLGGLLSYLPNAPSFDPIGREGCAPIDPAVRDAGMRLIPDSPARAELIGRAIGGLGHGRAVFATARELVGEVERCVVDAPMPPSQLIVEVDGNEAAWREAFIRAWAAEGAGGLVTLHASGASAEQVAAMIAGVRKAGDVVVHVRTGFDGAGVNQLLAVEPDILSLELPDPSDVARWDAAHSELASLTQMARAAGLRTWIVPRLVKSDSSVACVEGFHDRWLLTTGGSAIDPHAAAREGERITPLPLPASALKRWKRSVLRVRADGSVRATDLLARGPESVVVADAATEAFGEVWRRVVGARRAGESGGDA